MKKFYSHMQVRAVKGFTLIELLVVIAIIAILASIILASLSSARTKSRDARRLADQRQLQTALELYNNNNGGYPVNTSSGSTMLAALVSDGDMPAIPQDPGSNTYYYAGLDSAGGSCTSGRCPSYVLRVQMENNNATLQAQTVSGTFAGGTIACSWGSGIYYYCVRP